jgi:hypothetical protein
MITFHEDACFHLLIKIILNEILNHGPLTFLLILESIHLSIPSTDQFHHNLIFSFLIIIFHHF